MSVILEATPVIQVEEATTLAQLDLLRSEWEALWRCCPEATPFQSPGWLIPWWQHLGEGELWVLLLRQEGRLVGLAPFVIQERPPSGCRELVLMGTGITDYLDVLLASECSGPAMAALFGRLGTHSDRWDLCDFQQLRPSSPLLSAPVPLDWTSELTVQEVCPVLMLPEKTVDLAQKVPPHMLQKLFYYRRRLRKLGRTQVQQADVDNFPEIFGAFLQLHRARWARRGQEGVLAAPSIEQFHWDAAARLLTEGVLRLFALWVNDRIVASLYSFSDGKRAFFYLSGFDPEFAPLSPGTLMIGHALETAIEEGAEEFDFLRGREAYKYLWGAKGHLNHRRKLWHRPPALQVQ